MAKASNSSDMFLDPTLRNTPLASYILKRISLDEISTARKQALACLLSNLGRWQNAHEIGGGGEGLVVRLTSKAYKGSPGRDSFKAAKKMLLDGKWVTEKAPHAYYDSSIKKQGRATTIKPTQKFCRVFRRLKNRPISMEMAKKQETKYSMPHRFLIEFKDEKKRIITPPEGENLETALKHLKALNAHNLRFDWTLHCLKGEIPPWSLIEYGGQSALYIPSFSLAYKRIFNNQSWNQGGRFYNSLTNLPSVYRYYVRANGKRLIELDYKAMQLTLLYAEKGLEPPKDPYSLGKKMDKIYPRSLRKTVILMMINCDRAGKLHGAMFGNKSSNKKSAKGKIAKNYDSWKKRQNLLKYLPDIAPKVKEKPPSTQWDSRDIKNIRDAVLEHHSNIKDRFFVGAGLFLQSLESRIVERASYTLINKDLPIFIMHDGILSTDEAILREAMIEAFQLEMGVSWTPRIENKTEEIERKASFS